MSATNAAARPADAAFVANLIATAVDGAEHLDGIVDHVGFDVDGDMAAVTLRLADGTCWLIDVLYTDEVVR